MIRSTLFISAALAVVSVVLTSLWIGYGPRPQVAQDKRASTVVPLSKQERTGLDAKGQAIRTITPGRLPIRGRLKRHYRLCTVRYRADQSAGYSKGLSRT